MEIMQQAVTYSISDTTNIVMAIASIVSAVIAAFALILSLVQNHRLRKESIEQRRPQLSMKLVEKDVWLILGIKNTGLTAAKDIKIDIIEVKDNLDRNSNSSQLESDFKDNRFELYPEESIEGRVCIRNYRPDLQSMPSVIMNVSYLIPGVKERVKYQRSIALSKAAIFNDNLTSAVRDNGQGISSISRSVCRVANYLDGKNLYSFDEINAAPEMLLRDDIETAIRKAQNTEAQDNKK